MNINQILNSALLNEEAGEFGDANDVKKSGGFEGLKQGVKDIFINDPAKLALQRKKKEEDKKYYAQEGEFGEVPKDDSDSQPGSKVKAGNSELNDQIAEPSAFDKIAKIASNAGNQVKDFYSQHGTPINLGLGAAALGGLGYLAYKKLKKDKKNLK